MIDNIAAGYQTLDIRPDLKTVAESAEYQKLLDHPRWITVAGRRFYVLEGDLLLDEVQLAEYALRRQEGPAQPVATLRTDDGRARLLGITQNGKLVRWQEGKQLTYYVDEASFPSEANYSLVRDKVREAAEAWMKHCGIVFAYRGDLDTATAGRDAAVFGVTFSDVGGKFIAAAFFPNDPPARRLLIVDPTFFDPGLQFDQTGVFRHELGHVLGFRHEHIRSEAPPVCQGEPLADTISLADYDPRSVMHYFCGGVGTKELEITDLDILGAQRLYGLPASAFHNIVA